MILTDSVDLKDTYPLIVMPSHDGKFFQNYVLSLRNFVAQSQTEGLRLQMLLHQGESLISRVILPPYFRTRAIRNVAPARSEQAAVGQRDAA